MLRCCHSVEPMSEVDFSVLSLFRIFLNRLIVEPIANRLILARNEIGKNWQSDRQLLMNGSPLKVIWRSSHQLRRSNPILSSCTIHSLQLRQQPLPLRFFVLTCYPLSNLDRICESNHFMNYMLSCTIMGLS